MESKTYSPCPYCDGRDNNCADCELQAYRALGPVEELTALVEAKKEGRLVMLEDVTAHQANTIMGMCERLNAIKARRGNDQEPLITWQLYNAMLKSFTRAEAEAALPGGDKP